MAREQRRLAAIVATAIVGCSRLNRGRVDDNGRKVADAKRLATRASVIGSDDASAPSTVGIPLVHFFCLLVIALCVACMPANAQPPPCGASPNDWCPAPRGDPCGRHHNTAACRADGACYGMPYRGESVVRCIVDARGFASNCPTVGCTSAAPPTPPK